MTDKKKRYIKVPPELGDGDNWTVMESSSDIWQEVLSSWADNSYVGDVITFSIVEMTEEEFNALPPI